MLQSMGLQIFRHNNNKRPRNWKAMVLEESSIWVVELARIKTEVELERMIVKQVLNLQMIKGSDQNSVGICKTEGYGWSTVMT